MIIGTADFPAPRRIPAMQWENARRKKKNVSVRACAVPMAMTSGVLLKAAISQGIQT